MLLLWYGLIGEETVDTNRGMSMMCYILEVFRDSSYMLEMELVLFGLV